MSMFGQRFQTRPPPPSGQPPRYVLTRYFRANLRPVIVGIAIIGCGYALLWGGSSFNNLRHDRGENLGVLIPFNIALGVAYMVVAAVEFLGIFGALKQSVRIIGLYFKLSFLVSAIVLGAEIVRLIVHFKFKNSIIDSCTNDVDTDPNSRFRGDEVRSRDFCNDAWSHDTFSNIAWLLVSTLVSLIFASMAFSYYRQLLDPSFGAARARPQEGNNVPLDTFRAYGQYDEYAQGHGVPYNAGQQSTSRPQSEYAPPYEPTKLPGYGGYAADVEPDKKASEHDKDLAGVNH